MKSNSKELTREMLEELNIRVEFDEEGNPTIYHLAYGGRNHPDKRWFKITPHVENNSKNVNYLKIRVSNNKITTNLYIHRIVYAWVHGKCTGGMEIDHINHDTHDNRVCNLREVTRQENCDNIRRVSYYEPRLNKLIERVKYLESLLDKEGIDYD